MTRHGLVALVVLIAVAGCGESSGRGSAPPGTAPASSAIGPTDSTAPPTSSSAATVSTEGGPTVATHETTESIVSPPLDVTLYVPVVSGISPAAAGTINRSIDDEVRSRVETFRRGVAAAAPEDVEPPSSFVASFEVTAATPEVLSIRFRENRYFQGAVSGISLVYTQTFDPTTGELLALDDIVAEAALPRVATLAKHRLVDDVYAGDHTKLRAYAAAITPDMLEHWSLSPLGLEITFAPGQVGAEYLGPITVVVPYPDLAGLIETDGPAAALADT